MNIAKGQEPQIQFTGYQFHRLSSESGPHCPDYTDFLEIKGAEMAPTHNLHSGMPTAIETVPMSDGFGSCKATTLQSVLRGEIPAAYSHLTSHTQNNVEQSRPIPMPLSRYPTHHLVRHEEEIAPVYHRHEQNVVFGVQMDNVIHSPVSVPHVISRSPNSPPYCPSTSSPYCPSRSPEAEQRSPYYNHRSSPYLDHRKEHRSSPYPDTRSLHHHRDRESTLPSYEHERSSPYLDQRSSPYAVSTSPRLSCSPYNLPSSPYTQQLSPYGGDVFPVVEDLPCSSQDKPMDLSCKSDVGRDSPARLSDFNTPCDSPCSSPKNDGSMLRNLLVAGKRTNVSYNSDSDQDSSPSESFKPDIPITSSTRVTLAKKNMFPITSRVSDWLVKAVKFSKSIPEFATLSQNDKMTLLLNSWTRLILLYMAEQDFEFAVTPLPMEQQNTGVSPPPDEPSMKSVESIQSIIKKCKSMCLDQKEYALLRMAVLFNAGKFNVIVHVISLLPVLSSAECFQNRFSLEFYREYHQCQTIWNPGRA